MTTRREIVQKIKELTQSRKVTSRISENGLIVKIENWNSNVTPQQVVDSFSHVEYYRDTGEFLFLAPDLEKVTFERNKGIVCPICRSPKIQKEGFKRGRQRYSCSYCGHVFVAQQPMTLQTSR